MKFSDTTIKVLKNCSEINPKIIIHPGNTIRTISESHSLFMEAVVPEDFDTQVCIYDLNSLISCLTYWTDTQINVLEDKLLIQNGNSNEKFSYLYSDPSVVNTPASSPKDHNSFFKFTLTKDDINDLKKTAAILSKQKISFVSKDGVCSAVVTDPSSGLNNTFEKQICESNVSDFNIDVDVKLMNFIEGDYDVEFSEEANFILWSHKSLDVRYWMATEITSNVG